MSEGEAVGRSRPPSPQWVGEGGVGGREGGSEQRMDERAILDELRDLIVKRLRFDPKVVAAVSPETPLPKGIEGALGLDSLDFIELSIALEERFGLVVQEGEAVEAHFATLGALARFVAASQSPPA
jgi:acyl carrier protein